MLFIAVLLFIAYLSIKFAFRLSRHKQIMLVNSVSSVKIIGLQLSCLLYIVSLAGFALPFMWLDFLRLILGLLLLLPGIILGKQIATQMEIAGTDKADRAGRLASNVMWLGIGIGIFITANIVIVLLLSSPGSPIP